MCGCNFCITANKKHIPEKAFKIKFNIFEMLAIYSKRVFENFYQFTYFTYFVAGSFQFQYVIYNWQKKV